MAGPFRGEIWNADLDPTKGREQAGRRPVLVVLPITSKAKGIPWHVPVKARGGTGLRTESYAMVEAIRCISRERLAKRLGDVADTTMGEVETRLRILLDL